MTLRYTDDRKKIVAEARARGMTDAQFLSHLVSGEYGVRAKRKLILEWAPELGLSAAEALDLAVKHALLPA